MEKFYLLLFKQLDNLFFLDDEERLIINESMDEINERFLYNCSHLRNKYYSDLSKISPYHSCQYTMFLYFTANTIFKKYQKRLEICDKIYNLQKMLSGADIYYEIDLPEIFMFDHPVGTVLGRAEYGNYFSFSQGCTVGNNKGIYPTFGDFVILMSNAKVLGDCNIGNNVIISANTYIKDTNIPSNSMVFAGQNGKVIIKPINDDIVKLFFDKTFIMSEEAK